MRSWNCYKTFTFCSLLARCRIPCACHAKRHPYVQKCSDPSAFPLLTSTCASRHDGVHFFDISTSKSGPRSSVFNTFVFEMCSAPQRRALFRHLNFHKWSGPGVFCTFWLRNVLRATTVCNFSSLICPDGSAPAALASLLFNPPEPQMTNHWKNTANRLSLPFRAPASSFFSLFLFSGLLSSSLLLSDSPTSAFPSVHIVGSLTSKLPYRCGKPMLSHPKMLPKNGHLVTFHPPSIFYGITQSVGWFPL